MNIPSYDKVKQLVELQMTLDDFDSESDFEIESSACGSLPPELERFRLFTRCYNYDKGHSGRFPVFESDGASLQPEALFSMEKPLSFIRDVLSQGGDPSYPTLDEAVVFGGPGHTPLCDHTNRHRTSPMRLDYYCKVLGGLPMADIHVGTQRDMGDIDISIQSSTADILLKNNLIMNDENDPEHSQHLVKTDETSRIHLRGSDRDNIGLTLAAHGVQNYQNTALQKTFVRLIDTAVSNIQESAIYELNQSFEFGYSCETIHEECEKEPHLVLIAYSGTSIDVAASVKTWKEKALRSKGMSMEEAEVLLRKSVTIVTLGAISQSFPDGPAYIHVSMRDDPLVSSFGVSSAKSLGGGKDAVYLHSFSPYYFRLGRNGVGNTYTANGVDTGDGISNDAHNLDSGLVQLLAIIMRVNGLRTFRKLYELGSTPRDLDIAPSLFAIKYSNNDLDLPPNLDEEILPAMIRATGGNQWLWNTMDALGDDGIDGEDSPIPSEDDSNVILEAQFGYDAYEDICNSFI